MLKTEGSFENGRGAGRRHRKNGSHCPLRSQVVGVNLQNHEDLLQSVRTSTKRPFAVRTSRPVPGGAFLHLSGLASQQAPRRSSRLLRPGSWAPSARNRPLRMHTQLFRLSAKYMRGSVGLVNE